MSKTFIYFQHNLTISHSTSAVHSADCPNEEIVLFRNAGCKLTFPNTTSHPWQSYVFESSPSVSSSFFIFSYSCCLPSPHSPFHLLNNNLHTILFPSFSIFFSTLTFNGRPLPLGNSLHPQLSILITDSTFPLPPISQFTESWNRGGGHHHLRHLES